MKDTIPAATGHQGLQERLNYWFGNPALLQLALTHPSVAHEHGASMQTNQRLEFLGDAVLQLVLTRELYEKFPAFDEGPLTKARAQLVNRRSSRARPATEPWPVSDRQPGGRPAWRPRAALCPG